MPDKNHTSSSASSETKKPEQRRFSGLLIFAVLLTMMLAISYRPSVTVETIFCNAETLSPAPDVIMLSTSWCPYCYEAKKYFARNEISYCEYDIEKNNKGREMYDHANRYATQTGMHLGTPILFIGDHQLSGFNENRIEELLLKLK